MQGALLKLQVKNKLLHSGKVPVVAKEWQLRPLRRGEARLQQMRGRLAAETPEEREARLQRMSTNQSERLAVETPEERKTRLQQLSTNQRERLAVETPEEKRDYSS